MCKKKTKLCCCLNENQSNDDKNNCYPKVKMGNDIMIFFDQTLSNIVCIIKMIKKSPEFCQSP